MCYSWIFNRNDKIELTKKMIKETYYASLTVWIIVLLEDIKKIIIQMYILSKENNKTKYQNFW